MKKIKQLLFDLYSPVIFSLLRGKLAKAKDEQSYTELLSRFDKNFIYSPALKWFQKYYYSYKRDENRKLKEAENVLVALNINLVNNTVLEIGPANGYFLDVCKQKGAEKLDFIDMDPYFYYFLQMKGYDGILGDHWKAVHELDGKKYSLIYSKGAMIVDDLLREKEKSLSMMEWWLSALEKATNKSGMVVICPHWRDHPATKTRIYHGDLMENDFVKFLTGKGYKALKLIESHNIEPNYPITFYKTV